MTARTVLRITTAKDDLARIHPWLERRASRLNLPDGMVHAIGIALEEAAMNAAMHGFPPGGTGEIAVTLRADSRCVVLTVEDNGMAFDPTAAPPAQNAEDSAAPGGRGLILLRHYCQDLRHDRVDGRNRLTMTFAPLA